MALNANTKAALADNSTQEPSLVHLYGTELYEVYSNVSNQLGSIILFRPLSINRPGGPTSWSARNVIA